MPRAKLIESTINPYHLSMRCNNREWFKLPMEEVWDIMQRYLHFVSHAFNARIHAFVLMANHYHLIARFPDGGLANTMQYFNRETSRSIANATGRINHVYGGRYWRSEILGYHHFMNVYKYVLRNPVEVGAAESVQAFPYSTLAGLLGSRHLLIPVEEDTLLFGDPEENLRWLNQAPDPEYRKAMKRGLRRLQFTLPKDKNGVDHPLCSVRY